MKPQSSRRLRAVSIVVVIAAFAASALCWWLVPAACRGGEDRHEGTTLADALVLSSDVEAGMSALEEELEAFLSAPYPDGAGSARRDRAVEDVRESLKPADYATHLAAVYEGEFTAREIRQIAVLFGSEVFQKYRRLRLEKRPAIEKVVETWRSRVRSEFFARFLR